MASLHTLANKKLSCCEYGHDNFALSVKLTENQIGKLSKSVIEDIITIKNVREYMERKTNKKVCFHFAALFYWVDRNLYDLKNGVKEIPTLNTRIATALFERTENIPQPKCCELTKAYEHTVDSYQASTITTSIVIEPSGPVSPLLLYVKKEEILKEIQQSLEPQPQWSHLEYFVRMVLESKVPTKINSLPYYLSPTMEKESALSKFIKPSDVFLFDTSLDWSLGYMDENFVKRDVFFENNNMNFLSSIKECIKNVMKLPP